jgi:NADH-quinone oxidoreductase subunit L
MSGLAQASLWLMVLLPFVTGAVLAVVGGSSRAVLPISLGASAATVLFSAVVAVRQPAAAVPFVAGADFGIQVDALAALMAPTVALVTLLVLVFSAVEIRESQGRFHGLMLLFAASALLTTAATTLPALLLAWEVMGATSYALIGFWWREDHRVSAGLTAFLTTRTADVGLYVAAGAALAAGAGLGLADLPYGSSGWRDVVAAGVLVAALGKAAALPFSFWLSRAMEGPSPVSALLHSAAMVAMGGYLLLRVEPLLAATSWADTATAWLGVVTAVLLGVVALAQSDLKQLLAASTSAQLGYVVMAAGVASVSGGAAHLLAHAATKALLFLAAGAWLTALGTKQLTGLQGVAHRWRLVGSTATIGALSLAGVAPLALWATKDAVLAAALEQSAWLYAAGLLAAALSAAYAGKVVWVLWREHAHIGSADVDPHTGRQQPGTGEVGLLERIPLVVLAVGAAVLGVLALPPLSGSLARSLGEPGVPEATPLEMVVSTLVALGVVVAVARWRLPEPRWASGWLGLEAAAHAVVVRPTLRVAQALARFDDRVLDRAVDLVAGAVVDLGNRCARVDDRGVDGVVEGLASGVRRLGELARRPQSGQLYQYYLQAVVLLALGVVLVVTVR